VRAVQTSTNGYEAPEPPREGTPEQHRQELADAVAAARGAHELVEEMHQALAEVPELRREVARLEAELRALRATKTFRFTAGLRAIHASRRNVG